MCRGAKIILWQFVRVSKKGFRKKCALFVFVFFVLEKSKKENTKKMEKENLKESPEK